MDIDNGGQEAPAGVFDIEQSLLQQFSCMGTTDKDELIKQLQKLLGSHMNYNTAAFFLEMNNWNLQAAICSYFDVENPNKLPSMSLHSDAGINDNENIEPNQPFQKSWYVRNNGVDAWPPGCYVQCAGGESFGAEKQMLPALEPDYYSLVTIVMRSPSIPGTYQSKWRFCTPAGCYFGDVLWTIISVVGEGTMALTDQLSHLSDLGAPVPLYSSSCSPQPPPPSQQQQMQQQQQMHLVSHLQPVLNPFGAALAQAQASGQQQMAQAQEARGDLGTNNSISTDVDSNMS